jgi:hypothetical protein
MVHKLTASILVLFLIYIIMKYAINSNKCYTVNLCTNPTFRIVVIKFHGLLYPTYMLFFPSKFKVPLNYVRSSQRI